MNRLLLLLWVLLLLLLLLLGGLLLRLYELRIVNVAVARGVVHLQNGIDEGHQLLVGEDLLLHVRLLAVRLLLAALLCVAMSCYGGCEMD